MREECPMSRSKSRNPNRRVRRKFTSEFKADVVRLCQSGHESIGEVSRRLDLTETAVRAWLRQAEVDEGAGPPDALTTSEKEELVRLRRELKRVTQERDILKKATAFFARESS
jgi:transposase